jgi:hypothetical protein
MISVFGRLSSRFQLAADLCRRIAGGPGADDADVGGAAIAAQDRAGLAKHGEQRRAGDGAGYRPDVPVDLVYWVARCSSGD